MVAGTSSQLRCSLETLQVEDGSREPFLEERAFSILQKGSGQGPECCVSVATVTCRETGQSGVKRGPSSPTLSLGPGFLQEEMGRRCLQHGEESVPRAPTRTTQYALSSLILPTSAGRGSPAASSWWDTGRREHQQILQKLAGGVPKL